MFIFVFLKCILTLESKANHVRAFADPMLDIYCNYTMYRNKAGTRLTPKVVFGKIWRY